MLQQNVLLTHLSDKRQCPSGFTAVRITVCVFLIKQSLRQLILIQRHMISVRVQHSISKKEEKKKKREIALKHWLDFKQTLKILSRWNKNKHETSLIWATADVLKLCMKRHSVMGQVIIYKKEFWATELTRLSKTPFSNHTELNTLATA